MALTRVASSTVSAASYFSTLQGGRKTLTEKEVLKAVQKMQIPGLRAALQEFYEQAKQNEQKQEAGEKEEENE